MTQEHERRSFFRIHDRLVLEFRQITPENFTKLRDVVQYNSMQIANKTMETHLLAGQEPRGKNEELLAYMGMMNKKLDTIIELLSKSQCGEIYHNVQTEIDLSGAGVQFESHILLQVGDYTELKIIVPLFPYPKITILCQVVRTENVQGSSAGISRVAMKFLVISEKERDLLINYVFVKEREYLRQKKETVS
jgi:c-di-GMP-binding flagellar brake protein YcgR